MKANRFLTSAAILFLAFTASVVWASEPVSDFPGASDFRTLTRPANSFIIGAMHIDNDEYAIPLGPVERNSLELGKSVKVTGPIDTLAYAGPKSASSLTTYTGLTAQLTAAGYKEVWSCARATCGHAFTLAGILDQPMIDSIHGGDWGTWLIDDLDATNGDIRYGTFRKGDEYMLVMAALAPGYPSGALLVRANGPANESVLQMQSPAKAQAEQQPAPSQAPATTAQNVEKAKSKARSIMSQFPR
jgi:hypothetical protein